MLNAPSLRLSGDLALQPRLGFAGPHWGNYRLGSPPDSVGKMRWANGYLSPWPKNYSRFCHRGKLQPWRARSLSVAWDAPTSAARLRRTMDRMPIDFTEADRAELLRWVQAIRIWAQPPKSKIRLPEIASNGRVSLVKAKLKNEAPLRQGE